MTLVRRGRSSAGFTLLELLTALAVLGLLLTGLSQGTRLGLTAAGMANRLTGSTADFEVVDTTLRRLIEGLDPGVDPDPAPFVGLGHRMECIAKMPGDGLVSDGPVSDSQMRASLFVDDAHRLILRWRPYLRARPLGPPPAPKDVEILSNVRRIELAYWRPSAGWESAWRSPGLPTLIRVRLRFATGDPRHWPDIVAPPLLDRP